MKRERKFPSEVVRFFKGLLYPKDHPLSGGQIEIKYMTSKEEDILTSSTLIQKGIVLDKLMESVIIQDGVKLDDLLLGDKTNNDSQEYWDMERIIRFLFKILIV